MLSPGRLSAIAITAFVIGIGPGLVRAESLPGPDSTVVRVEDGLGVDVTNEQFYEDAFIDTTFLRRQLVSTPETRVARMLSVVWEGTRGQRAARYQLRNEASLGDKIQRGSVELAWRQDLDPTWRLSLDPRVEYRHDRTFDRDLEEVRASFGTRVRHALGAGETLAELGGLAEVFRSSGEGETFLLDRNAARGSVSLDHVGLVGPEWRLEYRLHERVFPDSSERDHLEHAWEGRVHQMFEGGHTLSLETEGTRRQTLRVVTTSRDNYWDVSGTAEGEVRFTESIGLRLRAEGEMFRYDVEDTVLFFDYQVERARLELRRSFDRGWTLAAGPRVERLSSELDPGEAYWESGAALEIDYLGARSWWNVAPAAGWREYDSVPATLVDEFPGLHSSYAFYELSLAVDQPLPAALRIRGVATARSELHTDSAQDAISTYLSIQLRWNAR